MNKIFPYTVFLLFAVITLTYSCKTKKNASYEQKPMPAWVTNKPQSPFFYTGISSATKQGFSPSEYIQSAQQRALGDLAASISVNIESSSMLSIIENDYKISENFSRDITASASQELEGYELVESWEDQHNYWVYYRLSKEKYQQLRSEKKESAIKNAKSKYLQAEKMLTSNSHYNAIKFYADALAEIKPYLGETSYTFIDDEKIDLGSSIFHKIANFLSSMEIYYPENEIHIKRGVELDAELLSFQVRDKNQNPISNIPFRISFTGSGLLRNIETSGSDGKIICAIRRISSSRNVETLSLTMDMQNFSRISADPVIRNIIRSMPAPEKTIRVVMDKPSIFVSTHEKVLNNISQENTLRNSLKGNLGKDFTVIDDKENADYTIDLESNTTEKGTYINEHYVTMKCSIIMRDNNGNILLRRTIEDDHMGNNFESASRIAYQNTARTIERSIIRDIVNSIN